MTTEKLIAILRSRLQTIEERSLKIKREPAYTAEKALIKSAGYSALDDEAAFLSGLIGQIEREGVQP